MKMVIFHCYVSLPEGNHLEKYEFVNGKDKTPIYEMENNLVMFETTNRCILFEGFTSLATLVQLPDLLSRIDPLGIEHQKTPNKTRSKKHVVR